MKSILEKDLRILKSEYEDNTQHQVLKRVLYYNDLSTIFEIQEKNQEMQFLFSNEIKTLPVANQKQSGRCWIFAGLNVLREGIAKKYGLTEFEFSQNYTAFWDKFEKINYFIESMDDFLTCDYDDRTLQHILKTGIQDGGQWDMFVSLIQKYGVVPQSAMPETQSSSSTRFLNSLINVKLRQYAASARGYAKAGKSVDSLKKEALSSLYALLTSSFGMTPERFDFEYKNESGYHMIRNLTPQAFYEMTEIDLTSYISVIHAPTFDKPYHKTYTVAYLGNVVGGSSIKYLNLPMEELKDLTIKQLISNEVVWFGSDVARFGNRKKGVWAPELFDYEKVLNMNLSMSKADQLLYSQSAMNHAMVITGVHLDNQIPKRFKIENSWGSDTGKQGYFVGSDLWFDDYVYQAIINKKHLTEKQLENWNLEPVVLKPWDPMGSLAE